MLCQYLPLAFLALPGVLGGPVTVSHDASTYTHSSCLTKYGVKSSSYVPSCTKTHSTTNTAHRRSTFIPTVTVTPAPVTIIVIEDETVTVTITVPQETDTFTTTSSFETTETITESTETTVTTVSTTTTSVGDATYTVDTSSGATPIQSVDGNPAAKRSAVPRRVPAKATNVAAAAAATITHYSSPDDVLEARTASKLKLTIEDGKCVQKPERFPHAVYCHSEINVVTTSVKVVTAKRTVTSFADPSTVTVTSTNTHTTYDTESPIHASTTVTESTTETFSTTTTVTNEVTTTIVNTETVAVAPTATVYPGCPASNFISSRGGHSIQYLIQTTEDSLTVTSLSTTDAQACCQACQLSSDCAIFGFYGNGDCSLIGTSICQPTEILAVYSAPDDSNLPGYTIGNGNCGRTRWDQSA